MSVYLNRSNSNELIAQKTIAGLSTSEAETMRILVDVPEGTWKLEIVLDSDGMIAELDEANNRWNKTYDASSSGFESVIVVAGGSILGIATLALVLIRRRKSPTVSQEAEPVIDEQPKEIPPIQKKTGPTNVAAPSTGPKKRGPPPAKAPPVVEEQSPAEQAAAQSAHSTH